MEAPDLETSGDGYAARFSGDVGRYFLDIQERSVVDLLKKVPGRTVLDVGGAHGQIAIPLRGEGYEVTVYGSSTACHQNLERRSGRDAAFTGTGLGGDENPVQSCPPMQRHREEELPFRSQDAKSRSAEGFPNGSRRKKGVGTRIPLDPLLEAEEKRRKDIDAPYRRKIHHHSMPGDPGKFRYQRGPTGNMREQAKRYDRVKRPVPKRQFQKISHYIPESGIPSAPPFKVLVASGGTPVDGDLVTLPA